MGQFQGDGLVIESGAKLIFPDRRVDKKTLAADVVAFTKTGEVLAMAALPNFDLNSPNELIDKVTLNRLKKLGSGEEYEKALTNAKNKMWRNKAVVDSYEPGSCFKIMTMSMALEEGVVVADVVREFTRARLNRRRDDVADIAIGECH